MSQPSPHAAQTTAASKVGSQVLVPAGAEPHQLQPKATTDALAAAALCELFRGEGKELEQVSV